MVSSLVEDIKKTFEQGNTLTRIIIINIGVFVVFNLIWLFGSYANAGTAPSWLLTFSEYLQLSSKPSEIFWRPWTIATHMFLHKGFWHILWNMLFLYWFGRIVGDFIGDNKILPLYILGGLMGALFYVLSANILPYGQGSTYYAMGASAASMAMVVAAATLSPDYNLRLLLIGDVKLKYVAAVLIFLDLIGTGGRMNTGGHFGHLGGALMGFLYIDQLRKGNEMAGWIDQVRNLFTRPKKSPLKVIRRDEPKSSQPLDTEAELNRILDKIKTEGIGSLTPREKAFLERLSDSK